VGRLIDELFKGRILPFDSAASVDFARIASGRERAGNPIPADAVIAATASAAGADELATRNVSGFAGTGLAVVDPWTA
jgi:toxin FitB